MRMDFDMVVLLVFSHPDGASGRSKSKCAAALSAGGTFAQLAAKQQFAV